MNPVVKQFDRYTVHYGTVSDRDAPNREYVRVDCFYRKKKAGQILFGNSVNPGNYASVNNDEINLYFPLLHFSNIHSLLQKVSSGKLALYVEFEPSGDPSTGGVRREV